MELTEKREITHIYGLHARASTKLVDLAQQFESDIFIAKGDGEEVDAKSVLRILTLGVELGHQVVVRISGSDAEEAMTAIVDLIERDFDGV